MGGTIRVRKRLNETLEFHVVNGDEMVNGQALAEQMQIEQLCSNGNCNQIPPSLMKIKVKTVFKNLRLRYNEWN